MLKNSKIARGIKIKKARQNKGISQGELAKSIGKKYPSSISEYESGKKDIKFDDLKLICKILDLDISTL